MIVLIILALIASFASGIVTHFDVVTSGCIPYQGIPLGGFGTPCACYNDGYGVQRAYMIEAIDQASDYFSQVIFDPNNATSAATALYYATENSGEEGIIYVYMGIYSNMDGMEDACAPDYPLIYSWDAIWEGMHLPIDWCDTSGENHKQGGYAIDKCMAVQVDPNPHLNQPDSVIPDGNDPLIITYA